MPTRITTCTAALLLLLSGVSLGAQPGEAQKADTRAALAGLETWLGAGGEPATGGSKYLDLPALHAQVDGPRAPDPKVLAAVLTHLQSGAPGLDLPRFVQLRDALSAWVDAVNIPDAAGYCRRRSKRLAADYHPPTAAELAASKNPARNARSRRSINTCAAWASVGVGWREYLDLDEAQGELAAGPSAGGAGPEAGSRRCRCGRGGRAGRAGGRGC